MLRLRDHALGLARRPASAAKPGDVICQTHARMYLCARAASASASALPNFGEPPSPRTAHRPMRCSGLPCHRRRSRIESRRPAHGMPLRRPTRRRCGYIKSGRRAVSCAACQCQSSSLRMLHARSSGPSWFAVRPTSTAGSAGSTGLTFRPGPPAHARRLGRRQQNRGTRVVVMEIDGQTPRRPVSRRHAGRSSDHARWSKPWDFCGGLARRAMASGRSPRKLALEPVRASNAPPRLAST